MNLTREQLVDWFFAANPQLTSEFRAQWLAMVESPPKGTTRSEMISGMKQGINDTLTMAKWASSDERKAIDAALAAKGLPSLRKMEAVLKKKHQRILTRGTIRNDEEFYIVAEILADLEFEIEATDRAKLEKISHAYELRAKQKRPCG